MLKILIKILKTMSKTQNNTSQNEQANNETTGIGGSSSTENNQVDENAKKSQMEIDAEYIKKNFELQLPVKAKVTSAYGKRESGRTFRRISPSRRC